MTDTERLAALELTQKELCKTVEVIKTNDLPHILAIATSARFRAGITLAGLGFLGLMLVILGIMVALS